MFYSDRRIPLMRAVSAAVVFALLALAGTGVSAQVLDPLAPKTGPGRSNNPLSDPGATPGVQFLYDLDAKFASDTARGGGPAFSTWFAPDAVTLANGKAPVVGHDAIAATATWTPQSYQLTWTPGCSSLHRRRYGFHLGTLRGNFKRQRRRHRQNIGPLYDSVEEAGRRYLEGRSGRKQ